MASSVYLETTISRYHTAWRSPELVMAARQEITRDWWDNRRSGFDLFISQLVIDEASAGDPDAVARRLAILQDIRLLSRRPAPMSSSKRFLRDLSLPHRATVDALHTALAVQRN